MVLPLCALHYDSEMIYIISPPPCGKASYPLRQGNDGEHTFIVCGAVLSIFKSLVLNLVFFLGSFFVGAHMM